MSRYTQGICGKVHTDTIHMYRQVYISVQVHTRYLWSMEGMEICLSFYEVDMFDPAVTDVAWLVNLLCGNCTLTLYI